MKDSKGRFILGRTYWELAEGAYKSVFSLNTSNDSCGLVLNRYNYFGGWNGIQIVDQESFEVVKHILPWERNG